MVTSGVCSTTRVSAEVELECGRGVGLVVAVLDDDGAGELQAVLRGEGGGLSERAGAWHDDGALGDLEGRVCRGAQNAFVDEVVHGCGPREDDAGAEHCASADEGAFVDADAAADECVVLDDDGPCADGLQHASDLGGGREVDALADLGARADEGVGVDHCAVVDVGADVHVHGGHASDAAAQVRAGADG